MYVFPGKPLNVLIEFKLGEDPASPSMAAYTVTDATGEVVSSTPITVPTDATKVWLTIPDTVHSLTTTEKYRQHRIEISYVIEGMAFDNYISYFVIPDLFLDYNIRNVRSLFGSSATELTDENIDFYRSYVDLASGALGDTFFAALTGVNMQLKLAAKQLMFWYTMMNLLPSVRMNMLKTVKSETSEITRMANATNFDMIEAMIREKYALYLSLLSINTSPIAPVFLVVDTPTDAITGA